MLQYRLISRDADAIAERCGRSVYRSLVEAKIEICGSGAIVEMEAMEHLPGCIATSM
jgi:hypothetical protein